MRQSQPRAIVGKCGRQAACLCLGIAVALLAVGAGLAADAGGDAALKSALAQRGITCTAVERTDGVLRVTYENQAGHNSMVAAALVMSLAAPGVPADGVIEAVSTQAGKTLFQVRTPAAKVADFVKRSLSGRQQTQLRSLLAGPAAAAPLTAAPAPRVVVIDPNAKPPTPPSALKPAAEIGDALVKLGLENVRVVWQHNGDLEVHVENRTYRSDAEALGAVMKTVGDLVPPRTLVRVEPLRDEVSLGVFTFRAGTYDKMSAEPMTGGQLVKEVTASRDRSWFGWPDAIREQTPVLNSSRWRTDLLLRPGLDYTIGLEKSPFESTFLLRPELVSTVGPGLRASVRGKAELGPWDFTIDRALLTRTGAAGDNWLWTASLGKFRDNTNGGFLEGQWADSSDETRIGARLALVGSDFGQDGSRMAVGYVEHEFGQLGLTARATYGRFLGLDSNDWVAELERRFGESTLRIAGAIGQDKNRLLIGLSVPLGGSKANQPRGFRVRSAPTAELDYASTLLPVGDAMWDAPDLRRFRGDLTLPYARYHPEHLFGDDVLPPRKERWVAPSFEGTTGLIRIPTADVAPDGQFILGTSWIPKNETSGLHAGVSKSEPAYATVGFLPNLELSFRLTFYGDVGSFFDGHAVDWPYDLDRSLAAQYRLFKQKGWRPSLAFGMQDIDAGDDSSKVGRASYLVASRQQGSVGLHLGFGDGRFDGLFGGVEIGLGDRVRLLGEYDTNDINVGLRVRVLDGLTVDGAWLDGNDFGAAVSYQQKLP